MNKKVCFVFVCQPGELELKACALAASMRYFNHQNIDLVAALPRIKGLNDCLKPTTYDLFTELDVEVIEFASPFGNDYLIGNKIAALALPNSDKVFFLDSDILSLRILDSFKMEPDEVYVKPADLKTWGGEDQEVAWRNVYNESGLTFDPNEVVLSTVDRAIISPYFNAGVIGTANNKELSNIWMSVARSIDATESIQKKRPWLDQISLPVAIKKANLHYKCLNESYNYPAHIKTIGENKPIFCHYHSPKIIKEEPVLVSLIHLLCEKYSKLKEVLISDDDWRSLFVPIDKFNVPSKEKSIDYICSNASDLIITGMPRSGTSLFCNLLNKLNNVLVVNEPVEIFEHLNQKNLVESLKVYFRSVRSKVIYRKGIENKIGSNGEIIEDTLSEDIRLTYSPLMESNNFLLAVKNPLAFMARLHVLNRGSSNIPVVALVRHPYATITSWTKSFNHLKYVDLDRFPFQGDKDIFLDEWHRDYLERIRATTKLPVKYALLWSYLSDILIKESNNISIIKYEDLCVEPALNIKNILSTFRETNSLDLRDDLEIFANIKSPKPISKIEIDSEIASAVRNICLENIISFGYEV